MRSPPDSLAYTSVGDAPQTRARFMDVPLDIVLHDEPLKWRIVLWAPTAKTSLGLLPQISRNVSVKGIVIGLHPPMCETAVAENVTTKFPTRPSTVWVPTVAPSVQDTPVTPEAPERPLS